MADIVSCLVIVAVGMALVVTLTAASRPIERAYVRRAMAFHYLFSVALYLVTEKIFVISDVHGYVDESLPLRLLLEQDPVKWSIEALKSLVGASSLSPITGGSTGNMETFAGLGLYVTRSIWGTFMLSATASFFGKWALYTAIRDEVGARDERWLMICTMYLPSCVFWTAGLVKEAFTVAGLGVLVRGAQLLIRKRRRVLALLFVAYGVALVAAFKTYFLFAFVVSAGLWTIAARLPRAAKYAPLTLLLGLGVGMVGISVLGSYFPDYSVGKLGESIARHQSYVEITEGGSNYSIGDASERSVAGQIVFAPVALLTSLARPLPFEVHNFTSAIATLEVTALTVLAWRVVRRIGLARAGRETMRHPVLIFCVAFVVIAATGVGLATTNFGTLSRYRSPILPFYAVVIWCLSRVAPSGARAPAGRWQGGTAALRSRRV